MSALEPMTASAAELALVQTSRAEIVGVVGYAEGFALVLAGLGVGLEPLSAVRRIVTETVGGTRQWHRASHTFPAHLRRAVGADMTLRLWSHAEAMRPRPDATAHEMRLSASQIGSLPSVLTAAHFAGELLATLRAGDGSASLAASVLDEYVRAALVGVLTRGSQVPVADATTPRSTPAFVAGPPRGGGDDDTN